MQLHSRREAAVGGGGIGAFPATSMGAPAERLRRRLVRLVFVVYWLLIFEGALRKWLLPELEQYLFFIRVPVTLWLYWLALSGRKWPTGYLALNVVYGFAAAVFVLQFLQLLLGDYGLQYILIVGYGWLNYFFVIPLAFIIADQFTIEDILRLMRQTFLVAIAAALLVFWQFNSAPESVVNAGFGHGDFSWFSSMNSALGRVRPNGFFTSGSGQQLFVVSLLAFVLYTWMAPASRAYISVRLRVAATVAVLVMMVLSQSRGMFFQASLVVFTVAVGGVLSGHARALFRMWLWPTVVLLLMVVMWVMVFPEALESFLVRWEGAGELESHVFKLGILGRALYGFYDFIYYVEDTPMFGYLVGLGGNAASRLEWVQYPEVAHYWSGYGNWAEGGWSRHIIELGTPLGLLVIIARVVLVIWLGIKALRALRVSGDPLAMLLWGFVGIVLLNQPISGHGSMSGYAWIFCGLVLASSRMALSKRPSDSRRLYAANGRGPGGV